MKINNFLKALVVASSTFVVSCNAFSGVQLSSSSSSSGKVTAASSNNKQSTTQLNDSSSSSSSSTSNRREPWNAFRFLQQSSRFVEILPSKPVEKIVQPGDSLWKASAGRTNDFTFAPLDDVVMGGASSSSFDGSTGKWRGTVTDKNNGGFVGIRSTPFVTYDMSKCKGIRLKLNCKSPSRIKVAIRDSTDFNGIGWTTSVNIGDGNGKSRSVDIPFSKLIPTRFARTVSGETFSKDNVKGFQLVYSKFEYDGALNPRFKVGEIDVQVEEILAY